jgi:hypothetical protein
MVARIHSSLVLRNDSEQASDGWWKWSVWLSGPSQELARVRSVTYRLHPTFPAPVQTVTAQPDFRLESGGWGEFTIRADVKLAADDGGSDEVVRLEHWLVLGHQAERDRPTVFLSHALTDARLAMKLGAELAQRGVETLTMEKVSGRDSWEAELKRSLDRTSLVVPIFSETGSSSSVVDAEVRLALDKQKPLLPVAVGNARLPENLQSLQRVQFTAEGVAGLADMIAARAFEQFEPDET